MQLKELAGRIDGAFLRVEPDSSVAGLRAAVDDALRFGLRALCVPPVLAGTVKKNFPELRVAAVISYPLGADSLAAKLFAMQELAEQRIDDVDIVLDLFALANGNWRKLEQEAQRLGGYCREAGLFSKAIIETTLLQPDQIRTACEILLGSAVDCIKTSTGYHRPPTPPEHVRLIRETVGSAKQVKASGGIKTLEGAQALLGAGADILGISNPAAVLETVATVRA
jgi:deoxyribose-phosphate aldolase